MNRRSPIAMLVTVSALSLFACAPQGPAVDASGKMAVSESGERALASRLAGANGTPLGTVSVGENGGRMTIAVQARDLPPGMHGIHLHEKGMCDGPAFQTAGAHWNPGMKKHGRDNPQGPHLGDLPNLQVAADGTAKVSFEVAGATIASGATPLSDIDGTALVIHTRPDDYRTDPSGASGDRIACAVIAAPK